MSKDFYDRSYVGYPDKYLAKKYYDHVNFVFLPASGVRVILQFPIFDQTGIIYKWGFSILERDANSPPNWRELNMEIFQLFAVDLIIGGSRVVGQSGIDFTMCSWQQQTFGAPLVQSPTTVAIFNENWLKHLSYPVDVGSVDIRVECTNTFVAVDDTVKLMARVMGRYSEI